MNLATKDTLAMKYEETAGGTDIVGLAEAIHNVADVGAKAKANAEISRLKAIIKAMAEGLNTPWPFPDEKTEHDQLLIESAKEAGQALQAIGRTLNVDWFQWMDLPPCVETLKAENAALREKLAQLVEAAEVVYIRQSLSHFSIATHKWTFTKQLKE